jgi:hypothetical protein
MVILDDLVKLYPYTCNTAIKIPAGAESAFEALYEKCLWKPKGHISLKNGQEQTRILNYTGTLVDTPDENEPG